MKILQRNFNTPVGEIDLVARHRRTLVFVEVKTRRSSAFGSPAEAVGPRKQRQIIRAAKWYLNNSPGKGLQPRFRVVSVLVKGSDLEVEHLPGAFEGWSCRLPNCPQMDRFVGSVCFSPLSQLK